MHCVKTKGETLESHVCEGGPTLSSTVVMSAFKYETAVVKCMISTHPLNACCLICVNIQIMSDDMFMIN
jgi:hypothetical protein